MNVRFDYKYIRNPYNPSPKPSIGLNLSVIYMSLIPSDLMSIHKIKHFGYR